jgi:hypothetical protein
MKTNPFCRFGPQKIYNAVETIMKWREIQIPTASPTPNAASSPVPQIQTEHSSDSGSGSDIHEKEIPGPSNEFMSSSKQVNITTPRPASKQALAHVLIVDDNEINVKVLSPPLPRPELH